MLERVFVWGATKSLFIGLQWGRWGDISYTQQWLGGKLLSNHGEHDTHNSKVRPSLAVFLCMCSSLFFLLPDCKSHWHVHLFQKMWQNSGTWLDISWNIHLFSNSTICHYLNTEIIFDNASHFFFFQFYLLLSQSKNYCPLDFEMTRAYCFLRGSYTLCRFASIFSKGDDFCDFLLAF